MFNTVHPRFRTPWISTLTVGLCVAFLAATLPINLLGDMVNIGTLLAFVIVCAGVWIVRRRDPDLQRPFKTPWVPAVPILGIIISGYLMANLPLATWIRLIVWLAIGMVIYFGYGRSHSRVQRGEV
jgi:APA family basic amino acid/polyamine antiporter